MKARKPERVRMSRQYKWKHLHPQAIVVARPSPFGNPFDVETYGTQAAAVREFRYWLALPRQRRLRKRIVTELQGKDLACWCAIGTPCHADVLMEIANAVPLEPVSRKVRLAGERKAKRSAATQARRLKATARKVVRTGKRLARAGKKPATKQRKATEARLHSKGILTCGLTSVMRQSPKGKEYVQIAAHAVRTIHAGNVEALDRAVHILSGATQPDQYKARTHCSKCCKDAELMGVGRHQPGKQGHCNRSDHFIRHGGTDDGVRVANVDASTTYRTKLDGFGNKQMELPRKTALTLIADQILMQNRVLKPRGRAGARTKVAQMAPPLSLEETPIRQPKAKKDPQTGIALLPFNQSRVPEPATPIAPPVRGRFGKGVYASQAAYSTEVRNRGNADLERESRAFVDARRGSHPQGQPTDRSMNVHRRFVQSQIARIARMTVTRKGGRK